MKLLKYILPILLLTTVANAGSEGTGGGDPCENRIQEIAIDIKSWILKGGSKDLKLPSSLSLSTYNSGMISEINKAQVVCVSPGDEGYPVQVSGVPKTCRFDRSNDKSKITCDFEKLKATSANDQYVLIHHEYAGLAGFEKPDDAKSNYEISNQISKYLEIFTVYKLAVKNLEDEEKKKALKLTSFGIVKSAYAKVRNVPYHKVMTRIELDSRSKFHSRFMLAARDKLIEIFPAVDKKLVEQCYYDETRNYLERKQTKIYSIGEAGNLIADQVLPCMKVD